jgi:phosphatidylinositol alpha 1,6-mannosyltransferase
MSLRVAIVTESFLPAVNGVTNSVLRVLETLRQEGHEAIVVAPAARLSASDSVDRYIGFEVVRVPAVMLKQFQWGMPTPFLQATLANFAPDVIHVASPVFLGGQAIAVAQRLGIPCVAIYQTDISGYVERYGLKFARPVIDKIMATIHAPATINLAPTDEAASYLRGLRVPGVDVWGRGVDLDLFHPNRRLDAEVIDLKRQWSPNGELVVGFVGRLAAEKQVDRMSELLDIPGVRCVVVGDGPERPTLEARFAGKNVVFTGRLGGIELANAYAALDIFTHFGTEETFGQTIQEAQASGLPVVAPASGGPKFLIESGLSGFLVHPTRHGAFAEQVSELAENPGLRARVGEQARRSVHNKSWSANNAKLIDFYHSAIAQVETTRLQKTAKGLKLVDIA